MPDLKADTAARIEDLAAVLLAVLGVIVFGFFVYLGLGMCLAAAWLVLARIRLRQPKTWVTTLSRTVVLAALVLQLVFLATSPGVQPHWH